MQDECLFCFFFFFIAAYLCDAGARERYNDSHHVDGELELEELGDAVVNVSSPHDGFHDAGEVVVGENDVGCLLGDVCPGDALQSETDV